MLDISIRVEPGQEDEVILEEISVCMFLVKLPHTSRHNFTAFLKTGTI